MIHERATLETYAEDIVALLNRVIEMLNDLQKRVDDLEAMSDEH